MADEKCFECNDGTMVEAVVPLKGVRHGEEFTVSVLGLVCDSCGLKTVDNSQSEEYTKALSDAYREAHGLLTGSEIKERRSEWLGMSQQEFAEYLSVGVASVKRWEMGQIQDRAMDQLIRLRTDVRAAKDNLSSLGAYIFEQCVLSSIIAGDDVIDLWFSSGQKYTEQPQMKISRLQLPAVEDDEVRNLVA